jgi:hypothetical protein
MVTFASLDNNPRATDLMVTPNVSLYVEAGKAPRRFFPAENLPRCGPDLWRWTFVRITHSRLN